MATMINNNFGGNLTSNLSNSFSTLRPLSIINQNRIAAQKEVQRTSTPRQDANEAIDNVSAYTIEESLRIRTQVLGQANQNIQDDTALLKTAHSRGSAIVDSIKEIQKLATQATDEALTDEDRLVIQKDINRLVNQISADSEITFNGRKLIDGSATTGNPATATVLSNDSLYRGTDAATALTALKNSNGGSLGIEATDRITASYVQNGNIYTTSFTVGNNTLESIFVSLNKVNGMTPTESGGTTFTDAAFLGGGKEVLKTPTIRDEPIAPEVKIDPRTPKVARPETVIEEPTEVAEPGKFFIPSEAVPTAPTDAEKSAAYEELTAAVNTPIENLPEGLEDFVSSLQSEMRATQSDGSVRDLSDWTASESYQNLSDEDKALVNENAETLTAAFTNSGYADKVAAYNAKNDEYNEAAAQYAIYDNAIKAGAEVIQKPEELGEDATEEQQAEYNSQMQAYNDAVDNYSPQAAVQYVQDKAAYEQYQTDLTAYNNYVSARDAWADYDQKHGEYLTYKNETLPAYQADKAKWDAEFAQYQIDKAEYDSMAVDAVQNDLNGLSVTARTPGLEGQISGVSINVTDASGNVKSAANAALNNFKTTTFADDEREDNSVNFQIGETVGQTMNLGFNDMRAEAFGLKGANGKIISISTKADADAAISTINNALTKAADQLQTIGSSEKKLGYIADSLAIEIANIQEPDLMIRNAGMAKTLTVYTTDLFRRNTMQSMFAMANQHSSAVLGLLR